MAVLIQRSGAGRHWDAATTEHGGPDPSSEPEPEPLIATLSLWHAETRVETHGCVNRGLSSGSGFLDGYF